MAREVQWDGTAGDYTVVKRLRVTIRTLAQSMSIWQNLKVGRTIRTFDAPGLVGRRPPKTTTIWHVRSAGLRQPHACHWFTTFSRRR